MLFGLFKRKSEIEKLKIKHQAILEKALKLSTINPQKSKQLMEKADRLENALTLAKYGQKL